MNTAMRRRQRQSGNAMLELAIGVTVLLYAFTGTFQFGYTFYRYDNIETAVNNGARYAAQLAWDSTDGTMTTAWATAVKNQVVYGDPTGTMTTPALPGLTTAYISVIANNKTGTVGVPGSI